MAQMRRWLEAASNDVGLDPEVISSVEPELLRLIGIIAHGPSRPGAPLTAYLVGFAAAQGKDPQQLIRSLSELASTYVDDEGEAGE